MLYMALALSCTAFVGVRYSLRHGFWIPIGKGFWIRRWYAPVNHSDEELMEMLEHMRLVCHNSIGTVLDYPVLKAKTPDALRKELHNKLILEVYCSKLKRVVAFHMAFWTRLNVHIGLVMVDKEAQGQKLQQVSLLNINCLIFDWLAFRFRMSDIGYSSSAFRIMSETVYKSYPNLYYKVNPERWHMEVAQDLLKHHRRDMGISATATFDPTYFIVRGSNASTGGGAHELVNHVTSRKSRMGIAAQWLEDLMQPEDEQLYIGEANIFVFLWRNIPLVPSIPVIASWMGILGIFTLHNYAKANVSWYTRSVLKLMGMTFTSYGTAPQEPCIWVANHYSYLDALLLHAANPNLQIVAKADLMSEVPDNVFTRFMLRVFVRGGFMWYDRNGDDTIRERVGEKLQQGKSVLIFSEGTSQRSGPPQPMRRGVLLIAKENNVPILPVALRYSMPIGLTKGDKTMRNFGSVYKMRNIVCGVKLGQPMRDVEDIEDIRSKVTTMWEELGETIKPPLPQGFKFD
eukprot:TRINITY_DN12193_c0_g1_i10.p1 TRINITY_DN12193_c0_g1~~TRINITY_DN12193_c0_g1_i10.p1  ORF type:complete len:515 (+),score=149.72 TRINITY_DN12193_c0_g1_i10:1226-2770(+)